MVSRSERSRVPPERGGVEISTSFWWDEIGGVHTRSEQLVGDTDADVVIVGAGFTGLWTALELASARPAWRIVVIEAQTVGFGASGRNGGWLSGVVDGPRDAWEARCGRARVVDLTRELKRTVDVVAAAAAAEGIDCALRKDGALFVASSGPHLQRLREHRSEELRWGADDADWQHLDRHETDERLRVANAVGALYTPHCARIQPARLVDGLADAVMRRGVVLHEHTPALTIESHRVTTPRGSISSKWVIRATEGFTARLAGQRGTLLPMNSAMIMTEPLSSTQWKAIGWDGFETMQDGRFRFSYLQKTDDGSIAIGGRGRPYRYGSRTDVAGEVDGGTVNELRRALTALFPSLEAVGVRRAWCGVLGVARDWSPSVSVDRSTGLCSAGGYAGDGVAATNLAARTLRDLILEDDSTLTRLPWVGHRSPRWEPEPLRWIGVQSVRRLYEHIDRVEQERGRPSRWTRLANRVSGHR